jgi:3-carboxy-cis,cis-muconate cycloisomerase
LPSDRLFGPSLTTDDMAAAVSDTAWLAAMLRFEAALATVQGRQGLISGDAVAGIVAACNPARFDVTALGHEAVASASPVVPLVAALRKAVGQEVAPSVHRDATSQDVIDSAMMLISRDGIDILLADLAALAAECANLAERHRDTPIAGRTLLQIALPTTFGCKAAIWLEGILDARRGLAGFRRDRLAVQLGGPVGTFSGSELVADLAQELDLAQPDLPWQAARNRVAELAAMLAITAGAAAKIALDVALLAQSEVAEVVVAAPGHSSSMPHKRNPAQAIEARAAFALATAQAGVLLGAMAGEHERAAGAWQSEWPALTELFRVTAGAVARTLEMLTGLQVDAVRMRANLGPAQIAPDTGGAAALVDRAIGIYRKEMDQ